jgi:drug/metabolite transporter (DMT)-like permease
VVTAASRPHAVPSPGRTDLLLLTTGVLCASAAGPLVAASAAPALAIAFWRNALGALVVLPYAGAVSRAELRRTPPRRLALALLAGALLAAHFASLTPSLRYTSVASAAALVCTQTVWAGLFSRLLGERLPARAWVGTGVALSGVLLVTGVDVSLSARALTGDVLALLGGMFGGAYIVVGAHVRRSLSTSAYTAVCYSTAALVLLAACLGAGVPLHGWSEADWLRIVALTVLAQLLGHSIFNLVLRSTSPTMVSLATLFTVPTAAVLAAVLLGQTPPLAALPAFALLLVGTALVLSARSAPALAPSEEISCRPAPSSS